MEESAIFILFSSLFSKNALGSAIQIATSSLSWGGTVDKTVMHETRLETTTIIRRLLSTRVGHALNILQTFPKVNESGLHARGRTKCGGVINAEALQHWEQLNSLRMLSSVKSLPGGVHVVAFNGVNFDLPYFPLFVLRRISTKGIISTGSIVGLVYGEMLAPLPRGNVTNSSLIKVTLVRMSSE